MTISSTVRSAGPYTGNGTTTSFAFAFKVFAASDVAVTRIVAATGAETLLTLGSDYTVSLNADQDADPGGTVTYPVSGSPLPSTLRLRIDSAIPALQPTAINNSGALFPKNVESALDRAVALVQQLTGEGAAALGGVARFLRVPTNESVAQLPAVADRANRLASYDAAGNPIAVAAAAQSATALTLDLANTGTSSLGDALIGVNRSDGLAQTLHAMLEAYTFLRGNQTPVAGGAMRIDLLREANAVEPLQSLGGIWPLGPVHTYAGISKEFNTEVVGTAGGPFASLFVTAVNNNNNADVCSLIASATAWTDNDTVFGANIIARNRAGTANTKLVGAEIDVVPASGTTPSSNGGGLFINAFNAACPIPAIQLGGVGGGTFNNGLVIGGISASGAGVAGQASATMGALINTGTATYNQAAIVLSNQHRIRLSGTAAVHGQLYNDGSNNVRAVLGSGAWIFRDSADAVSLASISNAGGQGVLNIETASGEYRVNGTKVVGARGAAVTAPTGGATIDSQARTAINDLISRLQSHGLIS